MSLLLEIPKKISQTLDIIAPENNYFFGIYTMRILAGIQASGKLHIGNYFGGD